MAKHQQDKVSDLTQTAEGLVVEEDNRKAEMAAIEQQI